MAPTFKCYLCAPSGRAGMSASQLTSHLTQIHEFPAKKFLQATIRVKNIQRRVILHEMHSCPIGGCKAGYQEFTQQRIIAHVQKDTHKQSPSFDHDIEAGYYFWWPLKFNATADEEDQISTAFTDPEKREAALARIHQSPEALLDPEDGAGGDLSTRNDDDDSYDLEVARSQTAEDAVDTGTRPDDHHPVDDLISPSLQSEDTRQSLETTPSPTTYLINMPNLNCPLALLQHNFAILHLPEFEGNPTIPVCILCRTIINSADYPTLRKHRCSINNDAPDPDSTQQDSNQRPDDEIEPSSLPGIAALDPSDVPAIETGDGIDDDPPPPQSTYSSWHDLRNYFKDNYTTLVKVKSVWPTSVIAPISFLPVSNGYGCPVTGCPRAYPQLKWAKDHIRKHAARLMDSKDGDYQHADPPPCSMQTLGVLHGKSSFFRVSMPEVASSTLGGVLSEAEFIARAFERINGQDASVALRGLPFKSPFFKRFDYQSIYPPDQKDYTKFVTSRLIRVSASYTRKQKPRHHLLAIVALVYTRTGGFYLNRGDHIVRRHLGNKLSSDQLGSAISRPFSNLQETSSILRYSSFFASLVAYVMDVAVDPSIDLELILSPEHNTAALALHTSLTTSLGQPTLIDSLALVRSLGSDAIYADPPEHFKGNDLKGIILTTCLQLQDLYHELAFAIVKYPRFLPPHQNVFRSPVHRFLALGAWNAEHKVFFDVVPLHNVMAHLQWSMRMVVYHQFYRITKDTPEDDPIPSLTQLKDECASQDASTPFGLLQDQIRYAGVLTTQYTVVPNATYDSKTQTAYLNGIAISRVQVRDMFHKIKTKLYHILDDRIYKNRRQDIFVASTPQQLSFNRTGTISDIPSSPHFGYSYLTANSCFKEHKDGLRNLFIKDAGFRSQFLQPFLVDNTPVWNMSAIDQWIRDVDHFKSLLAAMVYWLSGMPPRGVEFTATLIYNISNARRNIYCAQGDLVLEHTYSKSEANTGHSRPVMRQPPHDLQQALEEYIVVVKDVYDTFVALRCGQGTDTSPEYLALLWTYRGRQMTTEYLSQTLRKLSMDYLGQSIGIRSWRQYQSQFAHNILSKAIIRLPLTVTALASQASHGPTADRANYDRQTDTTFAQVNSSQFLEYQCISLAWGEAWGFHHPTKKSGAVQAGEDTTIRQETDYIATQLSHQINFDIVPLVEASVARAVADTRAKEIISSPFSCRFIPLDIAVTPKALSLVNSLHKSDQGFRSVEQAMCIQYSMDRGATPLFVVHPMGHGKSSIYLAPMLAERGTKTTLLIVPLLSLAQSAQTVAAAHGFNAKFFNPNENSPQGKQEFSTLDIVVMTYDLLVHNPTIVTWLREMTKEGRLSRVVVDEAHTLVTEEHYRTSFTRVYSALATLAVPHIFLSGTMPEACCIKILENFQNYHTVFLSRLPGDRNNLAYSVDTTLEASEESIDAFASRVKTDLYPKLAEETDDRILIFCRTVHWAQRIAEALGCRAYTSKEDLESKQEQLMTWLSSTEPGIDSRLLVGTSCISLGLDHPNVRHVWFYGDPHDAITFIQTASRAGRNGKPAFVRLFPSPSYGHISEGALDEYKSTKFCRRTPFSLLLDARRITCAALPHSLSCDNCADPKEYVTPVPHPAAFIVATTSDNIRKANYMSLVTALFSSLNILESDCCFCLLSGRVGGHKWNECGHFKQEKLAQLKAALKTVHTRDSIPHLAICMECHMPQKGGYGLGMDDHGQTYDVVTNTCGYVDTSLAIMIAVLDSPSQRHRLLRCTPSQRVAQVIPSLLTPVDTHPCSKSDTGRQLLQYHHIIIAAVAESKYATSVISEVVAAPWFAVWIQSTEAEHIHGAILPSINLLAPLEQPPHLGNKRRINETQEGALPVSKRPRNNLTLGEADLIPRQWDPKGPSKSRNTML